MRDISPLARILAAVAVFGIHYIIYTVYLKHENAVHFWNIYNIEKRFVKKIKYLVRHDQINIGWFNSHLIVISD